ncbi:MAG: DUF389 domain-containing protein, partial [Pseudonocardiales bacterium]|nr:DUF389 domain-containing protein [Pseudonocardiales bacterium]
VPAAGYAAVAAVEGRWGQVASSIGQLAVNLVGIVVAAVLVLLVARRSGPGRPGFSRGQAG